MAWIKKLILASRIKPMNTIFLVLCGTIIVSALMFLVLLLRVPLDDKDFWLKTLSAVLASLVFAVGIPALIVSHIAGKDQQRKIDAQQERLLILDKETAEAKRKLLETQERMRPRVFAAEAFANALRDKASGSVMIRYDPNALDAYEHVGMIMQGALEGAGWHIINPMLPAAPRPPDRIRPGITIEGLEDSTDCETRDTPSCSLWRAFKVSGLEPIQGIGGTEMAAADLPKGVFCIVIGPRSLLDTDPAQK